MFTYYSSLCGGFRLSESSISPSTASIYGLDDENVKQDCNRDSATPMTIDSVCLSVPSPSVVLPLLEAKYVVVWLHNQSKESMMILPNHNLLVRLFIKI